MQHPAVVVSFNPLAPLPRPRPAKAALRIVPAPRPYTAADLMALGGRLCLQRPDQVDHCARYFAILLGDLPTPGTVVSVRGWVSPAQRRLNRARRLSLRHMAAQGGTPLTLAYLRRHLCQAAS